MFYEFERGISLGCPLSPLVGALYLQQLDVQFANTDVFYVRYMDDILVMAKTRWKLKRAIGLVNRNLEQLRLKQHPDKTWIGRIEKGFDFLGYHICPEGLTPSEKTVSKFLSHCHRLYEQERRGDKTASLGHYVNRWKGWCSVGFGSLVFISVRMGELVIMPYSWL